MEERGRAGEGPERSRHHSKSPPRRRDDRPPSPRSRWRSRSRSPDRRRADPRDDRRRSRSWSRDRGGPGGRGEWRQDREGGRGEGRGRGGGRGPRRPRGAPGDDDYGKYQWGTAEDAAAAAEEEAIPEKEPEPDFGLSGALAAETNTVNGVVLLHNEPSEARPPTARWRLYVFKDGKAHGDPLHVHRQSRYLFGRERRIADIPTDHPSCSKQHAVLQYRLTEKADGGPAAVRPYLMDLGSTNGTFLNGERLEPQRYYELLEQDLLKFGNSSREYVLIKEK
jgi:smad nuclear-interacting protein 1